MFSAVVSIIIFGTLIFCSSDARFPMWSPDGSKIAFRSNRDEYFEIYIMDTSGTNIIKLTSK